MLRLKGERDTDERDEITREDLFPGDELTAPDGEASSEVDAGRPTWTPPLRGLAVAAGTFVPTFLLIFFGLPYVLGSAAPARTPTAPAPSPLAARAADPALASRPSASEVLRGDVRSDEAGRGLGGWLFSNPPISSPPAVEEPKAAPPRSDSRNDSTTIDSPRVDSKIDEPAPAVVPDAGPSLPPPSRPSRAESSPTPAPRTPEASRRASTPAAPPEPRAAAPQPAPEPRPAPKESREWTPAAAFTDRAAAGRLASSIEKQGYPVEIRQDSSSSRPWVVWIGAQPTGSSRRR
jgi:hypothetical protein